MTQNILELVSYGSIGAITWWHANKLNNSGSNRVSIHLHSFSLLWLIMAAHAIFSLWAMSNFQIKSGTSARFTNYIIENSVHMLRLCVSVITNIYLLRATNSVSPPDLNYSKLAQNDRLTIGAFWISSLVSVFACAIAILKHRTISDLEIGSAYFVQGVISAGLTVNLSRYYSRLGFKGVPWGVFAYVSTCQIFYVAFLLLDDSHISRNSNIFSIFRWMSFVGMAAMSVIVLLYSDKVSVALSRAQTAISDIDVTQRREHDKKFVRFIAQIMSATMTTGFVIIISILSHNYITTAFSVNSNILTIIIVPLSFLLLQLCLYTTYFKLAHRIDWAKQINSTFRDLRFIDSGGSIIDCNHAIIERSKQLPTCELEVVLVHGFGGSGTQSWGLLPAFLLEDNSVARVHLLSYPGGIPSRHSLNRQVRTLKANLNRISRKAQIENKHVVVIAHSLGALLSINALDECASDGRAGKNAFAANTVKHLVCIAPPLFGTPLALLGLPYKWSWQLLPGSRFIRQTIKAYGESFGEAAILGDITMRYSCSIIRASGDELMGKYLDSIASANIVDVDGSHSTWNEVYYDATEQAEVLKLELHKNLSYRRLVQAASLFVDSHNEKSVIFKVNMAAPLLSAVIHVTAGGVPASVNSSLDDYFPNIAGIGPTEWRTNKLRVKLESILNRGVTNGNLGRIELPRGKTILILFWHEYGCMLVKHSEGMDSLREPA